MVNKYLKLRFDDQNHDLVQFKEHGSALKALVPVLRTFITKRLDENLLLIKEINNLTAVVKIAIEKDSDIISLAFEPRATGLRHAKIP